MLYEVITYDLTSALAQGQKVIIGVDSGELWQGEPMGDLLSGEQADHALIVAGVITSYSIHYTKLYDALFNKFNHDWNFNFPFIIILRNLTW